MQETQIIQFASDNYVGVHPEITKIITESMEAIELPYGADTYSEKAKQEFQRVFQTDCETYFVGTGTAANIIALKTALKSINSVICSDVAHINNAECGALENSIGAKIIAIKSFNGKINANSIKDQFDALSSIHFNKPKVISITQTTELGTVYTCAELKEICEFAHTKNLIVHMDGSRLANAAASLNKSLKEITVDVGVDILSLGATKNGALLAEAIVIFNKKLTEDFLHIQKQAMQLYSKMRFIPAQFLAYFKNDLWLKNAMNANCMARKISENLHNIKHIKLPFPTEANILFLEMPIELKNELSKNYYFYVESENKKERTCIIRLITSYNTTEKETFKLISDFKNAEYNFSLK